MRHSFVAKLAQVLLLLACMLAAIAGRSADKPNILPIWGEDVGWINICVSNHDMMGYRNLKIDRVGWMRSYQAARSSAVCSRTGEYRLGGMGLKGTPRELPGSCPARAGDDIPCPSVHRGNLPANYAVAQG